MPTLFYLSTCDTCKRILKELNPDDSLLLREIKSNPISEAELEKMYSLAGSYEALINKRARMYKERNLKGQSLSEQDYKALLLEHYTFLKRPVVVLPNSIFVGNSPKVVQAAKTALSS